MSSSTFYQLFLLFDVFIIGVLSSIAFRHAYAHYRPDKHQQPDKKPALPPALKERMLQASEEQFQKVLDKSVHKLEHDLESSSDQINNLIKRFAGDIVGEEMERYRAEFTKLHKQTEEDMTVVKQEMTGHEAELKERLAAELEAEKQHLIAQIDTKLGDAIGSFLVEALQHNVDLGSQTAYLVATLEEHKDELKQEVTQ